MSKENPSRTSKQPKSLFSAPRATVQTEEAKSSQKQDDQHNEDDSEASTPHGNDETNAKKG